MNVFDQINDCFVTVHSKKPTQNEKLEILDKMPREIKLLAMQWDWGDTEVADKLYAWIRDEYK